jgi:hypothetical protein
VICRSEKLINLKDRDPGLSSYGNDFVLAHPGKIPTLSQWGILFLYLILLIIGVTVLRQKESRFIRVT